MKWWQRLLAMFAHWGATELEKAPSKVVQMPPKPVKKVGKRVS